MGHHHEVDVEATGPAPVSRRPHVLTVLWQRKLLVVLGIVVGLVLATLYYAQATPVYQSTSQVLVVKKRSSDAVPVAGGDPRLAVMEDYLSSELIVIRSPIIAERAVKKRDLTKLPSLAGTDAVGVITRSLSATREKDSGSGSPSNVINLAYRGTVPEDCKLILEAVIESYKDHLDEIYSNFSDETLRLITQAGEMQLRGLREKEKDYREFRETSPLVWKGKEGLTVQQERVSSIESRRNTLNMRQATARDRLKDIEKAIADGRPRTELLGLISGRSEAKENVAAAPDPITAQMLPLLLQEQQLQDTCGPGHPDLVAVRKKIAFLRNLVKQNAETDGVRGTTDDPVEQYVYKLRKQLREDEAEYQSLTVLVESESKEARRFDSYAMQDENYRNDITRNQKMYDTLVDRLKEMTAVRKAGGGFDAAQLSRPAPGGKLAPNLYQIMFGGAAVGLILGVGLAYLGEITDKGFRTAEEIRRRLGLPVIGHIPLLTPDPEARDKLQAGEPTVDPYLVALHRPKSVEAEAYRAVRTALYFSTHGAGHSVFQVTSPDKGDGKSTLVTNLAVCMAQSGKKTIVLDADLRRPRMHRMFGQPAPCGLADVIAGRINWRDAVRPGPVPNLFVLPCGPLPPNPAELLTSPEFQAVLDEVRAEYDFVLVDTPPLLAVTDPCVVAPRVDGVILTLRLSKKSGPQAERAREILSSLGVKVIGVVVNGVTTRSGASRLGGGQYEYTYGSNEYTSDADETSDGYYEADANEATPPPAADSAAPPLAARPGKPAASGGAGQQGLWRWLQKLCGL